MVDDNDVADDISSSANEGQETPVMKSVSAFTKKLALVQRLRKRGQYARALAAVDDMRAIWPGNAQLHVLWATLVQLADEDAPNLDEARKALEDGVEFGHESPAAAIELGHFLDAVDDDPHAASAVFSRAVETARNSLIDALLGQAAAMLQLGKKQAALRCALEVLSLVQPGWNAHSANGSSANSRKEVNGVIQAKSLKGPFARKIRDLLTEATQGRSA